jgi:hypothetical protein
MVSLRFSRFSGVTQGHYERFEKGNKVFAIHHATLKWERPRQENEHVAIVRRTFGRDRRAISPTLIWVYSSL